MTENRRRPRRPRRPRNPILPPPPPFMRLVPDWMLTARNALGVREWAVFYGFPVPSLLDIEAERTLRGMRPRLRVVEPLPMGDPLPPPPPISAEAHANTERIRALLALTPAELAADWPPGHDPWVLRRPGEGPDEGKDDDA